MEDINELLQQLRTLGIAVSAHGDELKVRFAGDALPKELLALLRRNKTRLLRYLQPHSIDAVPVAESYPISSSQFRLWVICQLDETSVAYNMPGMYVFQGDLDRSSFGKALDGLIRRHESLRTVFRENEQGEVRQHVLPAGEIGFRLIYRDLQEERDKLATVDRLAFEAFLTPFDLARGPLLYAALYRVEHDKWILAFMLHHIIGDGWSMQVFLRDLSALYDACRQDHPDPLPALRLQYKDYTFWRLQQLAGETLNGHKRFWLDQLSGELPVLQLPGSKIRPAVKTYRGGAVWRKIDLQRTTELKRLAREQGGTLFMGLLAAVIIALYHYTNREDLIVGTPVFGRDHVDLEHQIGFYVNTLALRMRFKGTDSFREMLLHARDVTLASYEHQIYPFDDLVEALGRPRDMSRNPLFDVMVILQNTGNRVNSPGAHPMPVTGYEGRKILTSKFDLTFDFVEIEEAVQLSLVYNRDIYDHAAIDQLASHFKLALYTLIAQPEMPIRMMEYPDTEGRLLPFARSHHDVEGFNSPVSTEF
jgi:NRPS condensation-like uncharacterized protein